jgi:signal transduction histidine kinase
MVVSAMTAGQDPKADAGTRERDYRDIFEHAPVSIWEEDWSDVYAVVEQWRAEGIDDIGDHASATAGLVEELIRRVRLVDVNAAAVSTYRLQTKEQVFAAYRADMNYNATSSMRGVFLELLRGFATGQTHVVAEAVDRTSDGAEIDIRLHACLTPEGRERWRRVLLVIEDVTELKQAESELRAAHAKLAESERLATIGRVAATVSHELRNPLGAISASLAFLLQKTTGKGLGVERTLDRIDRNIERCNAIISDLLEFTRRHDLDRAPTEIDTWLEEVLAEQAVPADILLERSLEAKNEVAVDRDRFRQVVLILVNNALQALKDPAWRPVEGHRRRIAVRAESVGPEVRISITDNGPGIPTDVLPRIFEPLFTTKGFGVGLGLPIARRIVEQHGGAIGVTSAPGEGTTVTIRLPR